MTLGQSTNTQPGLRPPEKTCTSCGHLRARGCFGLNPSNKDGLTFQCGLCVRIKDYRVKEKRAGRPVQATYAEIYAVVDGLYKQYDGGCHICRIPVSFWPNGKAKAVLDHCHDTGRLRGILCSACNTLIGLAEDRSDVLSSAAAYVAEATLANGERKTLKEKLALVAGNEGGV